MRALIACQALVIYGWLMAGCGSNTVGPPDGSLTCESDADCQADFRCQQGQCVEKPMCTDFDQDGYCDRREGYDDCNDNRPDIHPGAVELCDGKDNDCDEQTDEDCPCNSGDTQACGTDVGACAKGMQSCADGAWGECQGGRAPDPQEDCDDDLDNDCNGAVNDACSCSEGDSRACGSALGVCTAGVQTCDEQGGSWIWSACQGGTPPGQEICGDELDEDCDGSLDNGCACAEANRPCGLNVGICHAGLQQCIDEVWSTCLGARLPEDEVCDGLDNDCDQITDEGCECLDGVFETCGSNVGECSLGARNCVRGRWGPCEDETPPAAELCDGRDNDCNGEVDETFTGLYEACQVGQGICARPGAIICSPDGLGTFCNQQPGQGTDEYCNGLDDDCDGETDEDFSDLGDACSIGVGGCLSSGVTVCDPDGGFQCNAAVIQPQQELCDTFDNDCDGEADEDFSVLGQSCGAGVGACYTVGVWVCSANGSIECNANPPSTTGAESCDGVDNDCDGTTDEDAHVTCSSQCGQGYRLCINGALGTCTAPQPQPEQCDGIDNNCDGNTDEPFSLGGNCEVGVGLCQSLGYMVCNAAGTGTTCNAVAGRAQNEGTSYGYTCEDGVDNNCNGQVDAADGACDGSGCRNLRLNDLYSLQFLGGALGLAMIRRRRKHRPAPGRRARGERGGGS